MAQTMTQVALLRAVAEGLSNARIGDRFGITTGSAKSRVNVLRARFGAASRGDLVNRVFEAGLGAVPAPGVAVPAPDPAVDAELAEQLLEMARMIVADRPLGRLREVAHRVLAVDARLRGREGAR